jgi:hypothetical protein
MKALLVTLILLPSLLLAQGNKNRRDRGDRGNGGGGGNTGNQQQDSPPVEAPPLTPEQTANILKQLDDIEKKFSKSRGDVFTTALTRLKTASASEKDALELYIACYKTEHFDKLNLKQTDFQEWRQRQDDHFKDPEFLGAILLQARFLVLALQGQDATEKELPGLILALQNFINDETKLVSSSVIHTTAGAVKDNDKNKKPSVRPGGPGAGRAFDSNQLLRTLREAIQESEFCKAFQLEEYLTRQDWAYVPSDISQIYDQIIFPYYAEKKPTELAAQWDLRIKSQLAFKEATFTTVEYQTYYKERYPELLWDKSKYLLGKNIDALKSMGDMLKVIRDYPSHPKAGDWIKEMRGMVNKSNEATTTGAVSEATPPATPLPSAAQK